MEEFISKILVTDTINHIKEFINCLPSESTKYDKHQHLVQFLTNLRNRKSDINTYYFVDENDKTENYTLMQFATKYELVPLVTALLDSNFDPNYSQGGGETRLTRKISVLSPQISTAANIGAKN